MQRLTLVTERNLRLRPELHGRLRRGRRVEQPDDERWRARVEDVQRCRRDLGAAETSVRWPTGRTAPARAAWGAAGAMGSIRDVACIRAMLGRLEPSRRKASRADAGCPAAASGTGPASPLTQKRVPAMVNVRLRRAPVTGVLMVRLVKLIMPSLSDQLTVLNWVPARGRLRWAQNSKEGDERSDHLRCT
jgi:hypothetical protein